MGRQRAVHDTRTNDAAHLAATDLQDLGALEAARKQRQAALARIDSMPATQELRDAVAASLQAGDQAKRAIRLIRQRVRNESRRLDRIETGFVRARDPRRPIASIAGADASKTSNWNCGGDAWFWLCWRSFGWNITAICCVRRWPTTGWKLKKARYIRY